jgi:hypothetical protein
MSISSTTASLVLALSFFSVSAAGCAPKPEACPPVTSAGTSQRLPGAADRPIHRFDFVLTANDGTAAPSSTAFTMTLQEGEKGEAVVGRNVSLTPATPPGSPPAAPGPRQDVGAKVAAFYRTSGDDVVLEVSTEMSSLEPPTSIRKTVSKGNVLASPGKPAVVASVDDDAGGAGGKRRVQLTVTATKLR